VGDVDETASVRLPVDTCRSPVATLPAWAREIDLSLPLHPQLLLTGNVRDLYPLDTGPVGLVDVIWQICQSRDFAALAVLNPVTQSIETYTHDDEFPDWLSRHTRVATAAALADLLVAVVGNTAAPVGLVVPYAARLAPADALLDAGERALLATVEALGHQATPAAPAGPNPSAMTPYNTIFWVCERQEDLHAAFPVGSPALRVIPVPRPTLDVRVQAARVLYQGLPDIEARAAALGEVTHGMTVREVVASGRLARDRGMSVDDYGAAARLLQIGVTDDPWAADKLRTKIREAESYLNSRVLGQQQAVRRAVDILVRSATRLNGVHLSSSPNRPRGVLFLAGPTGVGKTELAKAIASLVLGGDAAPLRFDMSEFRADEAHQRLIGAPPGYVGHDAGGELTNAVRANPVSVLLFDEIDKAHPRIFDLFLQILEDGRLTDARGATVYFTECFLIFTSNLGVTNPREAGSAVPARVTYDTPPAMVEQLLREAFDQFFHDHLGRPELRNRFGDSFVVLDYIRPHVAPRILDLALQRVAVGVRRQHDLRLEVARAARDALTDLALARLPEGGGRAIGTIVESVLVNPLARAIFFRAPSPGSTVTVRALVRDEHGQWQAEIA
jgi:hypothetical protein